MDILKPEILAAIPNQPRVNAPLEDQLAALLVLAAKFGLEDACAFLRKHMYDTP